MTKDMIPEFVSAVVFSALVLLLINPMDFWMPSMAHMTLLTCAVIAFSAFVVFFLKESAHDERDALHRSAAGRAAFLAGSAILILGIVVQHFTSTIDMWLVGALIVMVLAKVLTRMWTTWYR